MHAYDTHGLPYFISSSDVMQFWEACYTVVSYAPYIFLQIYTITILATFQVTIFDLFHPGPQPINWMFGWQLLHISHYYPTACIRSNCVCFCYVMPIYGVIVFFCYVMSQWTIAQAIVLDIDWDYIKAWFRATLLIIRRRLSSCSTKMRVLFVYARRRYVAMSNMRHALVPCNTHNFVVRGKKPYVWVLVS